MYIYNEIILFLKYEANINMFTSIEKPVLSSKFNNKIKFAFTSLKF